MVKLSRVVVLVVALLTHFSSVSMAGKPEDSDGLAYQASQELDLFSAEIVFSQDHCRRVRQEGILATRSRVPADIELTLYDGKTFTIPIFIATRGLGARLLLGNLDDCHADLNGLTGMMLVGGRLSNVFDTYYGVNAGIGLGLGAFGSAVFNSSGIWIGSTSAGAAGGVDLSGLQVRVMPRGDIPAAIMGMRFRQ